MVMQKLVKAEKVIKERTEKLKSEKVKEFIMESLEKLKEGGRDYYI